MLLGRGPWSQTIHLWKRRRSKEKIGWGGGGIFPTKFVHTERERKSDRERERERVTALSLQSVEVGLSLLGPLSFRSHSICSWSREIGGDSFSRPGRRERKRETDWKDERTNLPKDIWSLGMAMWPQSLSSHLSRLISLLSWVCDPPFPLSSALASFPDDVMRGGSLGTPNVILQ